MTKVAAALATRLLDNRLQLLDITDIRAVHPEFEALQLVALLQPPGTGVQKSRTPKQLFERVWSRYYDCCSRLKLSSQSAMYRRPGNLRLLSSHWSNQL
jgi:hypothetical protein